MSDRACAHCGASNDRERVYCKDCGTRLPELTDNNGSADTAPEPLTAGLGAPPIRTKNYRRPTGSALKTPPPANTGSFLGDIFKLAILGFFLACLIQAMRQPDNISPAAAGSSQASELVFRSMQTCVQAPMPKSLVLTAPALNQFLESYAKQDPTDRVFATLEFGEFNLFVEKKAFGYGIFFSLRASATNPDGTMRVNLKKASIGRLPLPSFLTWLIVQQFQPACTRLAPAAELVQKAQTITITPNDITLKWLGTGKKTTL